MQSDNKIITTIIISAYIISSKKKNQWKKNAFENKSKLKTGVLMGKIRWHILCMQSFYIE